TTTFSESALNQKLIDNSLAAKKIQEASSTTAAPVSIKILNNKASSTTTTTSVNLTDQDKQLSENYVDQALSNKIITEKCVGEMVQGCSGNEVDHKTFGMSPVMMKLATQAYATFGALTDFMPVSKGSATDTKKTTEAPEKSKETVDKAKDTKETKSKEKAEDYCKYIPAGTETIATFNQQANIKSLETQISEQTSLADTAQRDTLLKAAKSHDSRAQQAQIQAVGWYGGAACYAYKAATGAFAVDTALVVKLGAATLLGTFYQAEVGANKDYAQRTRDIANSLPTKGACNPVTENDCYCAEAEHQNDPNYCKAQIAAKAAAPSFTRVACTDDKLKIDPTCACDKTNTCFDKYLEDLGSANIQLGMGYSNSPFKAVSALAHGKLEASTLTSQAYANSAAIAKKALSDLASKVSPSNSPLTLSQREIANAIMERGLPANVAQIMAQNSPSQAALTAATSKMSGIGGSYQLASYGSKSNVLDFSGGNGLGVSGKKTKSSNGVDDFLGKLNNKGTTPNSKILEFAAKAEARVPQITKSDKPIFEIISSRYQSSGRRLLQIDANN
ncbi:MAG: hypothetical protein Q7U04_11990, partial [Bacteriovorax sp.]|nr:hypothetical protein [Bacteriovorax sp.]